MFIKLQPDQISLFWETIRHGMIMSARIPEEFRQSFAINGLINLLSGTAQAWIVYDEEGDKRTLYATLTTRIIDEKYFGAKILCIDSLYGFRTIDDSIAVEITNGITEFANLNGCKVLTAEYSSRRIGELLKIAGFSDHSTISKKILQE